MLVSIGTLICPNCSNRFSAYGSGFSLTAPVLAFASATDPDSDNTQDLDADFFEDIEGYTLRLVGTEGSATVGAFDIDVSNVIDATEAGNLEAAFTTGAIDDGVCSFKCRIEDGSGNALSDWSNTVSKTIDATAPALSSATDTATGQTTADVGVTTNEANGTLYCVVTTSSTSPTAAQVKAGQDNSSVAATFADDQAVDSTGVKAFSATGLAAGTAYTAHFMHEDAVGNQSTVVKGNGLTTDSGATTWNPSDKDADITLSNGNLTAAHLPTGGNDYQGVRATSGATTGKKYFELLCDILVSSTNWTLGISNASQALDNFVGSTNNSFGWAGDGSVYRNGAVVTTIQTFGDNSVLCVAVDLDAELIWFRTNGGNWNNSATANPATGTEGRDYSAIAAGPYFPTVSMHRSNEVAIANFGATAYAQTAPSGFGNW